MNNIYNEHTQSSSSFPRVKEFMNIDILSYVLVTLMFLSKYSYCKRVDVKLFPFNPIGILMFLLIKKNICHNY